MTGPPVDTRWRVAFTATLLIATTVGGLTQFLLGVFAPAIASEFGFSRARIGSLTTVYFAVAALTSPYAGRLTDRTGGRAALLLLFGLVGVGIAAMAAATGYLLLAAAVGVSGLALALMNPVTNQLIAVHLPRGAQGVVTGVKQSGVQLGAFLAGTLFAPVGVWLGWRWAVLAAVVLALVGLAATASSVPGPARDGDGSRPTRPRPPVPSFVRWLAGYAFLMGAAVAAVAAFIVLYAVEALGMSEGRAGVVAAVVGGAGVVARILWGRAAERMATSTAPLLVIAVASVAAQALVWGAAAAGEWLLWVGAAAFGATAASWNSVGMLAIVREIDAASTGRASGIVQSAFYAGLVVCPVLFGASVDVTGGYDLGWAGVTAAFCGASVLALRWHARRHA